MASNEQQRLIEQLCRDLNQAHDELMKAQGVEPERIPKLDWPEWTPQANSIRWAERLLAKPLSKLPSIAKAEATPTPAEAVEREKLAAWMIANSFATGHGDTFDDLLAELTGHIKELRNQSPAVGEEELARMICNHRLGGIISNDDRRLARAILQRIQQQGNW